MLIAKNILTDERYLPYTEKNYEEIINNKDNLVCPYCKNKVIFVNGQEKIEHFRHKVENNCSFEPETIEHLNMKLFLINSLKLNKEQVEVNLGYSKPDLFIKEKNLAIEVQHSPISEQKFIERTSNYSKNGIYVLWIFDSCLYKKRVASFLRKAHELYFGRVYFFIKNKIVPIHFKPKQVWVEEKEIPEYIDNFEDYKNNGFEPYYNKVGGYYKTLKTEKEIEFGKTIDIKLENLLFSRNNWKTNNYLIAKFNDEVFWKK